MNERVSHKVSPKLNITKEVPNNEAPNTGKAKKKPRRDKSNLGEDFVAPDGGWAWMICIAAGMTYLSINPCLQQFGLIFRERLMVLGITNSQITTIINTNSAVSACTGLLNGPMFRRFTFRQVALVGALIVFVGIMMVAFCETFIGYITAYSLTYGFGLGICVSASSLAVNTYFQKKRRRATGFSWTITGLGPMFWPYTVSFLLPSYGVMGTCLIFAAISLHALLAAITYQPVRYHTKTSSAPSQEEPLKEDYGNCRSCEYCEHQQRRDKGLFSSQYLYQDNDVDMPGYEIIEPGTPMLSRANDGWFGSKMSLASNRMRFRTVSSSKDLELGPSKLNPILAKGRQVHQEEEVDLPEEGEEEAGNRAFYKPNNFNRERDEANCRSPLYLPANTTTSSCYRCTCPRSNGEELVQLRDAPTECSSTSMGTMPFLDKLVVFFDLGLLRDITFVNLVMGLTIINFGELNFSILTPFILSDFGFSISQITLVMSILAGCDITVRFLVPFVTEKIPWDNRVFFLIGVVGIAVGRTVVACTRSFPVILCSFCWIGVCKGVRTIFWPLIIPSYVPLNRLPAASGLQLLITGIFSLVAGPFVGLIRDRFNYSICLHFLNMLSFIAAFSWTTEALLRRARNNSGKRDKNRRI